jgi:transcriptional activator HAC1
VSIGAFDDRSCAVLAGAHHHGTSDHDDDSIYGGPSDHHLHAPPPLSDDDLSRLFDADSAPEPDLSFLEDGLPFDLLSSGRHGLSSFAVDSLVDFDPESLLDNDSNDNDTSSSSSHQNLLHHHHNSFESAIVGLPDPATHPPARVQPCFGASTERCDEQGIAAGGR